MSDNDTSIRVNIRSATSTQRIDRVLEERYFREIYQNENINLYNIYFEIDYEEEDELPDNTLSRNPVVSLNITAHNCGETEINKECSICQSKFNQGEKLCTLSCMHIFHYNCMEKWVQYKPKCPLCRKEIPILER